MKVRGKWISLGKGRDVLRCPLCPADISPASGGNLIVASLAPLSFYGRGYRLLRAAWIVLSMSSSVWAREMNQASKGDGGR